MQVTKVVAVMPKPFDEVYIALYPGGNANARVFKVMSDEVPAIERQFIASQGLEVVVRDKVIYKSKRLEIVGQGHDRAWDIELQPRLQDLGDDHNE